MRTRGGGNEISQKNKTCLIANKRSLPNQSQLCSNKNSLPDLEIKRRIGVKEMTNAHRYSSQSRNEARSRNEGKTS
jgi:hypothetical protein